MNEDWRYKCINAYVHPDNKENWINCPNCGLRPKVWVFDNGRSTACGCGDNDYEHFSIHAESIMSVHNRNGNIQEEYYFDDLRNNWNHWCETGEELFKHAQYRNDNRW